MSLTLDLTTLRSSKIAHRQNETNILNKIQLAWKSRAPEPALNKWAPAAALVILFQFQL